MDILVTRLGENSAKIAQLSAQRNWMDETYDKHAYMCFPLTLTNRLGWGISFPEDISFIWDGISDTTSNHIKVIRGHRYVDTGRANATISFKTSLIFKTDKHTTMLTMPVPNQFVRGAQCYTTLISTSFYMPELPIAWKITEPNIEITIPAGQPVAAVLPISLTKLQFEYTLKITDEVPPKEYFDAMEKYGEAAQAKNGVGDWSRMYKNAIDHNNNKTGEHETKSIRLKTVTCPVTGIEYLTEPEID
jgi:hypothetical protein